MPRKPIKVSKNPQRNWDNDAIQFARLLVEADNVDAFQVTRELCESMDLTHADIRELMDRAQAAWDDVKSRTKG